ncbi:MAG: hypothetical protein K6E99_03105 [Bacilli bacterium]|nr:hypothetical protein [Bacilli bacterium]
MIELIALGLLSYPVSYAMNTINVLKVTKDVADNGYKFNLDNLKSLYENNAAVSEQLMKYRNIPFINMAIALYGGISYKTNRDNILLTLNTTDCFEKMTKEEEEYYSKNPNAISAILINKGEAIEKPSTFKMAVNPNLTLEERMAMKEEMEKDFKDKGLNVEVTLYPGNTPEDQPRFTEDEIKFIEEELNNIIESDVKEVTINTKKRTKTIVPRRKR